MDESASGAKQADLANSLSQLRQKLEDPSSALQDKQALEKMLIDALHDLSKM
jgi:predicted component of type VI protein secretion system